MAKALGSSSPPPAVYRLCHEQGWTALHLAQALGITRERVYQLWSETKYPDPRTVTRLAAILSVTPDTLVDADGKWR